MEKILILILIVVTSVAVYILIFGPPLKIKPTTTTTMALPTTTTLPTTTALPTTTVPITTTTTTFPEQLTGYLVLKITDKLDLTNITTINITVDLVEVHKAGTDKDEESNETFETNDTSSAGWETIVDETKSYNLIELAGTPGEVLGDKELEPGKYTQIRLHVSEAKLTDENGTYDVKVPSERFYWVQPFYMESGKMTTLTLDFDASESIRETGKEKYLLKPVVKIISEISSTTTTTITTTTTTTIPEPTNYSVEVSQEIGIEENI